MNGREVVIALSLVVFFFVIGWFPNLLFDKINPATAELAALIEAETFLAER
jgi:NADH:ubiquinone oxidoreductase subunit 4 (subunit M)